MSTVIDVITTGNNPIPVLADAELPIDLLNRTGIIEQIMQLLNTISDNRLSRTFTLSGTWGTGKTFVLNRLMKQLLDYQDGEKFFVFHYNCWQYDYYEEPLIAIVAAMLDSVDQESHLFSQSLREKAKEGMTFAKPILENIAKEFIKKKIGIDITDLISLFKEGAESLGKFYDSAADAHEYDKYYSFKKAIVSAQEGIRSLTQNRTVVVIVDEMDRCLPSYAIKVMERLHHLFANLDNTAVILAVDKDQLDQTVQQIFGADTDTTKYLKKFINFEVQLDTGRIEGSFTEKYADYYAMFDNSLIDTDFSFDSYFSALFAGIDARTQERIMERIQTVHTILFPNIKKDYSFMCMEAMWVVFAEQHNMRSRMPISYDNNYEKQHFYFPRNELPEFSQYIQTEWSGIQVHPKQRHGSGRLAIYFPPPLDIPQILIWYLWHMYANQSQDYQIDSSHPNIAEFKQNVKDLQKFDSLLKIIK